MGKLKGGLPLLRQRKIESSSRPLIDQDIKYWLKQRQVVLLHYNELCFTLSSDEDTPQALDAFCELLMDYLSFGHFKMFEKLAESYQYDCPNVIGLDTTLLNKISKTTEVAVDFNDKYVSPESYTSLSKDLSHLGETLAHRMDWEDQLLKTYSPVQSRT